MYNVLLVDDLLKERVYLENLLVANEMTVYSCDTTSKAEEIWNDKKGEIDAIVLDVMMPVDYGFDETLFPETECGFYTGWIWLWKGLNPNNTNPHPIDGKYIVVCSSYIDKLKAHIDNKQNPEELLFCKSENIKFINKGSKKNDEVFNALATNRRNKKLFPMN